MGSKTLLDLPPEVRAKQLARMGMTEDEYRAELAARQELPDEPPTYELEPGATDKMAEEIAVIAHEGEG